MDRGYRAAAKSTQVQSYAAMLFGSETRNTLPDSIESLNKLRCKTPTNLVLPKSRLDKSNKSINSSYTLKIQDNANAAQESAFQIKIPGKSDARDGSGHTKDLFKKYNIQSDKLLAENHADQ